jgi:phospholipid-binding lipoprotein MlaA
MKNKFYLIPFLFFLISCSNTQKINSDIELQVIKEPMNTEDPFEGYNRGIYSFNIVFNDYIGEPIANLYNKLPNFILTGFSNVFQNLGEPLNTINSILQGKPRVAGSSFIRFFLNSTVGIFGLIDVAQKTGLKHQKEDLGQTFYEWGLWQKSSFIMMPFVGPYTTRELLGSLADSIYNPIYPNIIETTTKGRILIFTGIKFIDYAKVIHLADEIKKQPDPYIFMRESYLQYRTNLIFDGNPPEVEIDNFDFDFE